MQEIPLKITTDRLILSLPQEEDIPTIVELAGDYDVAKTTRNMPHPYEVEHAEFWIKMARDSRASGDHYVFAQRLKSSGELIGGIGIIVNKVDNNGSLGYWIGQPFWNLGYTTEACRAIIDFGFRHLGLHKIHAQFLAVNEASGRVMIKAGMYEEAKMIHHVRRLGEYHDIYQYGILRSQWEE